METNYLLKVKIDDESTIVCTFLSPISVNSLFIVNNQDALYIGKVLSCDQIKEDIDLSIYEKGVRIPTNNDLKYYQSILKEEESLIKEIQKEANNLQLDMKIFKVSYSFDKTKFKILYTSDNRVDFRELLKTLARLVKARIEMKQVGPRDKAKTIGGLGVCGLKLCCSTFLNSFDGITISMAKNQMLAINIPKLSGQCGKLMCCLKYEDVNYTKLHPLFPKLGTQVNFENTNMSVTSINMLLMTVVLYDGNKYVTLKLEDFNKVLKGEKINRQASLESEFEPAESFSASFGNDISSSSPKQNNNSQRQNNNNNNNHKQNNKNFNNKNYKSNYNNNYRNNNNNKKYNNNNNQNRQFNKSNKPQGK